MVRHALEDRHAPTTMLAPWPRPACLQGLVALPTRMSSCQHWLQGHLCHGQQLGGRSHPRASHHLQKLDQVRLRQACSWQARLTPCSCGWVRLRDT